MADKVLGQKGRPRRRRIFAVLLAACAFALIAVLTASAGPQSIAAGFEGDDGNLVVNSTFDWNGFSPVTWSGTATTAKRLGSKTVNGWQFAGSTDAAATTSDDGFKGGVKQDLDCAGVISSKAPNKDDLKRIYTAHKTVGGDIYLALAWVRIPQNTTSASAHVGFEFNQGVTGCPTGSDGLVRRTAGDMLIVYDFAGSTTDNPILTVRRWITSGACEISSDSAPCWGPAADLTAAGFAEAKVNTTATALDTVAPTNETLGLNEFGEAIINLTDAGIFGTTSCTSFGQAEGVSRSSGNSGQAAMEDLVGPIPVTISNCGHLVVKKVTSPNPDPTDPDALFPYTVSGGGTSNSSILPKTFSLSNQQTNPTQVFPASNFSVAEGTLPTGWTFTTASCDNSSGTLSGRTLSSVSVAVDETVTCTFTNTLSQGAIKVTKTRKHAADGPGDHPESGVSFTVNGVTHQTNSSGVACFDGLNFGAYTVHETVPTGESVDNNDQSVTVDNAANCADATYVGETASFRNTPLTDITISVNSQVDGGTSSTITCDNGGPTLASTDANGDGSDTATDLEPNTYTCTIVVDP